MGVISDRKIDKLVASQGLTRIYELDDGRWLTAREGTVSWRNNNPGNLKFASAGSAVSSDNHLKRTKEQALESA